MDDETMQRYPQFMGWAITDDLIYSIQGHCHVNLLQPHD